MLLYKNNYFLFKTTSCIFFIKVSIFLVVNGFFKCEILSFNTLNGILIGWVCQNVITRMGLSEVPTQFFSQNYLLDSISRSVKRQFSRLGKLFNKWLEKLVSCLDTLIGQNWRRVPYVVDFLYRQTHFAVKPPGFAISVSRYTVLNIAGSGLSTSVWGLAKSKIQER